MSNKVTERILASQSESMKRLNPNVFGVVKSAPAQLKPAPDPLDRLNKTERAFHDILICRHAWVCPHGVTFQIAFDTRYTPDFVCGGAPGKIEVVYEVKGFMRDDARVKLFVAARTWYALPFILVTREKGRWKEVQVQL